MAFTFLLLRLCVHCEFVSSSFHYAKSLGLLSDSSFRLIINKIHKRLESEWAPRPPPGHSNTHTQTPTPPIHLPQTTIKVDMSKQEFLYGNDLSFCSYEMKAKNVNVLVLVGGSTSFRPHMLYLHRECRSFDCARINLSTQQRKLHNVFFYCYVWVEGTIYSAKRKKTQFLDFCFREVWHLCNILKTLWWVVHFTPLLTISHFPTMNTSCFKKLKRITLAHYHL